MNYKQYQFKILIKQASIDYQSTFNFKLVLKRGNKQLETKNNYKYETSGKKEVVINEDLSLTSILQIVDGTYKDKTYKLYLQVYTKQGFKSATFTDINLCDYINYTGNDIVLSFKKHPFAFLEITLNVSSTFVAEIENINDVTRLSDGEDDLNVSAVKKETQTTSAKQIVLEGKSKVDENEVIIKELREKIISLEKENKELKGRPKETKGSRHSEEVTDRDKIIDELKSEVEYYTSEISELKCIVEDLKSEKSRVYEEKIRAVKEMKGEIENLNEKLMNSEKNLMFKNKELADFKNNNEMLDTTIAKFNIKITNLE
jgi:hypothetical protein